MTKDDIQAYLDEERLTKEELKAIISELLLNSFKDWAKTDDRFYSGKIFAYGYCLCLFQKLLIENYGRRDEENENN